MRSFSLNQIDAAYLFRGGADPEPPEELLAGGRERGYRSGKGGEGCEIPSFSVKKKSATKMQGKYSE